MGFSISHKSAASFDASMFRAYEKGVRATTGMLTRVLTIGHADSINLASSSAQNWRLTVEALGV
jgi:hypothetical protein